ncbi:oocyte zinc finger protein XlCOF19-like isoform X2 [Cottoperca gobio]|nr:zinc finger protein 1 homolog isoform X2 [Cottoperca gobio]
MEQQEWSPSLDQEDPEPPHIKEELFISDPVPVKSEEDDEGKAQSSQLHESQTEENRDAERTESDEEDCRGSDPYSPLQPATRVKTSHSPDPDTDDSCDWEESNEPLSGLNPLQNNEVPVSDEECNTGKTSSSECARSFGHKEHLLKHTGVHMGETLFSCPFCDDTFAKRSGLTIHLKIHKEGKLFSCLVCKQTFKWRGEILSHMRIHTGEKPFSCSLCNKAFAKHGNLRQHMTVHTGEKPFSCSVCNKKFTKKGHMKQHLTVHTGEKPFSCSVCSKGFARHSNLARHLTVHTHMGETI